MPGLGDFGEANSLDAVDAVRGYSICHLQGSVLRTTAFATAFFLISMTLVFPLLTGQFFSYQ